MCNECGRRLPEHYPACSAHTPDAAGSSPVLSASQYVRAGLSAPEDTSLRYQRQTRNATVFIAVVVAVLIVLSVIGIVVVAHAIGTVNNGSGL